MTRNLFKNAIIFIILIGILLYFLYFFSLKGFINMFELKEHLVNIYKPNRVFYNDGKIYLMDTQAIMDENNPRIFETFKEFQKYILSLEEKHLIKLPLDTNDIKEGKNFIKQMEFEMDKSLDKPSFKHYKYSNKCNIKNSLCNMDIYLNKENKGSKNKLQNIKKKEKEIKNIEKKIKIIMDELSNTSYGSMEEQIKQNEFVKIITKKNDLEEELFSLKSDKDNRKNKMIDPEKLKQFKKKQCNINYFDDNRCETLNEMETLDAKKRKGLQIACDVIKVGGDICKDYNNDKWNRKLLKSFCVKDNMNYDIDTCMIGEYYKDNIMDFQ